ncbi:MAG: sensor histidine kinase [Actinomycetota bacterium]|nr:sensor histidine kinase [Actinomycetota bacterium]
MRQVLGNLLSNALRHTGAGGVVDVRAEGAAGGVCFTVEDPGAGIAEDQLPHVFDRFARSADSRGSGLGLSIAKDLVEAHGGAIHAGNRPSGGAVFTFTLPAGPLQP